MFAKEASDMQRSMIIVKSATADPNVSGRFGAFTAVVERLSVGPVGHSIRLTPDRNSILVFTDTANDDAVAALCAGHGLRVDEIRNAMSLVGDEDDDDGD